MKREWFLMKRKRKRLLFALFLSISFLLTGFPTSDAHAAENDWNYCLEIHILDYIEMSGQYTSVGTDSYDFTVTVSTGSEALVREERIPMDETRPESENNRVNVVRLYFRGSSIQTPVIINVQGQSSYFFFADENITGIDAQGYPTGSEVGINGGFLADGNSTVNGWNVIVTGYGESFKVQRANLPQTDSQYTAVLNAVLTRESMNIRYSTLAEHDVYAGQHNGGNVGTGDHSLHLIGPGSSNIIGGHPEDPTPNIYDALRDKIKEYNRLINMITVFAYGVSIITSALCLIISVIKLAGSSSHPLKRREAVMNILCSVICIALLGGISQITRGILLLTLG